MRDGTGRRSVLAGLGALGLMGCAGGNDRPVAGDVVLDFSELEKTHGGRIGLHVYSVWANGGWRSNERFLYCSTFKLFLAAAVLQRVARGDERLDRAVPVVAADMLNHAPVTETAVGGTLTIERLCQAIVEVSDNPAANILIRELGGLDVLKDWYRTLGDQVTYLDRIEPQLNLPDGDKDTTTPLQTIQNLDALFLRGERRLQGEANTLMSRWLFASPTGPNRIKGGVPEGYRVAHKTGTGANGPTNDIGLIYPPSGEAVSIAVYYDGPPSASQDQRDGVIAEATRQALKAIGHG